MNTYKVAICGGSGSGKTTLVTKALSGSFLEKHEPTLGVEVHPIKFTVFKGEKPIRLALNLWDTAGCDLYGGLRDGYFFKADIGLIIVDNQDPCKKEVQEQYTKSLRDMGITKIVIYHNKVDGQGIKEKSTYNYMGSEYKVYECSVKDGHSFALFLPLIQALLGDSSLSFE